MATIRKINGKWRADVRLKGLSKSKRFDSKAAAQSWSVSVEQSHGKHGGIVHGHTLADAYAKYAKEVSPTKKGARWEIIRLKKLARDPIADTMLCDLTTEQFQKWIGQQLKVLQNGSVRRELCLISAVLNTCRKKWKWMSDNPLKDVEKPKPVPPRDRRISQKEIDRILLALGYEEEGDVITSRQQIAVAFLFALETAMRQGEIWGLEWQRVNLSECFVRLDDTKNGTRRDVALSKRAIELVQKMKPLKEGRVFNKCSQATMEVQFRRAVELTGIKDLHWHDSRHESITRLARKLDVLDLARMVGHKDLRSLQAYYNATAKEIASRLG